MDWRLKWKNGKLNQIAPILAMLKTIVGLMTAGAIRMIQSGWLETPIQRGTLVRALGTLPIENPYLNRRGSIFRKTNRKLTNIKGITTETVIASIQSFGPRALLVLRRATGQIQSACVPTALAIGLILITKRLRGPLTFSIKTLIARQSASSVCDIETKTGNLLELGSGNGTQIQITQKKLALDVVNMGVRTELSLLSRLDNVVRVILNGRLTSKTLGTSITKTINTSLLRIMPYVKSALGSLLDLG